MKKSVKGGQQDHEEGGAGLAGEVLQLGGEGYGLHRAAEPLHGGPGPIAGQLQHGRRAGQLPLPVGLLALQLDALQPAALLHGIVGILHGQLGQSRRLVRATGGIEGGQLAQEDGERPAIGDEMVQGEQQEVDLGIELQQAHA